MSRTRFALIGLLVVPMLVSLLVGRTVCAQPAGRPNVLLICVDDLKPLIGCYGDRLAKTPNMDRLAARGVMFERAYCNQAVCSPSRNALGEYRASGEGVFDIAHVAQHPLDPSGHSPMLRARERIYRCRGVFVSGFVLWASELFPTSGL